MQPLSITAIELDGRKMLLSTEDVRYGGCRLQEHSVKQILPRELLIFDGTGVQQ
jgi:hypothetical protein